MALEGIATELQKKTGDTYNRGVFLSEVTNYLLWISEDTASESEDLSAIPSWSWASKGGPKGFSFPSLGYNMVPDDRAKIYINAQGHLRIQGIVVKCKVYNTLLDDESFHDPRSRVLYGTISHYTGQAPLYIEGLAPKCHGFAVFDRQHFDSVYFLPLGRTILKAIFLGLQYVFFGLE